MVNDDLSIFSSDPELTSLKHLSEDNLRFELQRGIPRHLLDAPASSYRVTNLRYSPKQKMVVGMTSERSTKPISLRIFPQRQLQNRLEKAAHSHPDHTFLLEDLNAIAWVFPGERKLKLGVIDEPDRLASLLREHRGYRLCGLELVHFVPEHTYTARVCGIYDNGSLVQEYLKIYYDDSGARTARIMRSMAQKLQGSGIQIANDFTYIADHRLLIQSKVVRDEGYELSMNAAAFALSQFHNLDISGFDMQQDEPASDHRAVIRLVHDVFPALHDEVNALSTVILERLEDSGDSPSVFLHGDAHLGNMFRTVNGEIAFIDLDRAGCGPATTDLASFLAFKVWLRLREKENPELIIRQLPQFVYAYNQYARHPVDESSLYLQLAHKTVTERIRRGITRGKVSSVREIRDFVDFAWRCVGELGA